MSTIELERVIRLALQHKCGVTRLHAGEASLAADLANVATIERLGAAIARHASQRLGSDVI